MADDQVTISFNNDVFTIVSGSDAGQQANYSGSVSVDYTTGTYSGLNFDVEGFGENSGFGDSGGNYSGTLGVGGNSYAATGGGFTLYWDSMTPSTARAVLVANGNDTYDTQANPADEQNQSVSSTVNSMSDPAVCFAHGTRIATTLGEVAVERLAAGDIVVTASGEHRAIRWIGHRQFGGQTCLLPHDQQPIRIRQGAFGQDTAGVAAPACDLFLSPGHPVLVGADDNNDGGYLVPIMCLINGTSIARAPVNSVTYWHVELDEHDILLAEGLPAESFLDYGNRPWFGPAAQAHALANPDHIVPGLGARCRPVAIEGAVVEAERRRLDALFAMSLHAHCAWPAKDSWLAI